MVLIETLLIVIIPIIIIVVVFFCNGFQSSDNSSTSDVTADADDGSLFTENERGDREYFAPNQLVQKLKSIQYFMAVAGIHGALTTAQVIWLKSKVPLSSNTVAKALWIVSRQIPHLQLCICRKGLNLWYKRIKNFAVDFETTTEEVMEVYQQMLETTFDLFNGPLWKVRIVYLKGEGENLHSTALVFCIHHVIIDGTSVMRIFRELIDILNKFSKEEEIKPCPIPIAPALKNSLKWYQYYLLFIMIFHRLYATTRSCCPSNSSNLSKTNKGKTHVLLGDFTEIETKKIIQMCRAAKITVNSFITTIMNFVLVSHAQSKADFYFHHKSITVSHSVNTRKFFEDLKYRDATGCYIITIFNETNMSHADSSDFWGVAKQIHGELKEKLEFRLLNINSIVGAPTYCIIFPLNYIKKNLGLSNLTECHYGITNMGNLKALLLDPKDEDNVEITYVIRSTAGKDFTTPFLLGLQTFRGRLMISMDSYTNKIHPEDSNKIFETFCQYIRNMVSFNSIHQV